METEENKFRNRPVDNPIINGKYPPLEFYKEINEMIFEGSGGMDTYRVRESSQFSTLLFSFVVSTQAKNILETGVRSGGTTIPLLMGAICTDGKVISVDKEKKYLNEFIQKCPPFLLDCWDGYETDSIIFLENCVEEKIIFDVTFIDDWHSYDHVKKQLELLDKLTTNKSIVLMHDAMANSYKDGKYALWSGVPTTHEFGGGGVWPALNDLDKTKYEYCTIPVFHGLTILRKL